LTNIEVGASGVVVSDFHLVNSVLETFSGQTAGHPGSSTALSLRLFSVDNAYVAGNHFDVAADENSVAASNVAIRTHTAKGGAIVGNWFSGNGIATAVIDLSDSNTKGFFLAGNHFNRIAPPGYAVKVTATGAEIDIGRNYANPSNTSGIITPTLSANDATPSVSAGNLFKSNNGAATTLTAFDACSAGKVFMIIFNDANTTVDFSGTTIKGNNGTDRTMSVNDALQCTCDGTNAYCVLVDQ
jgi:hypothetical protein